MLLLSEAAQARKPRRSMFLQLALNLGQSSLRHLLMWPRLLERSLRLRTRRQAMSQLSPFLLVPTVPTLRLFDPILDQAPSQSLLPDMSHRLHLASLALLSSKPKPPMNQRLPRPTQRSLYPPVRKAPMSRSSDLILDQVQSQSLSQDMFLPQLLESPEQWLLRLRQPIPTPTQARQLRALRPRNKQQANLLVSPFRRILEAPMSLFSDHTPALDLLILPSRAISHLPIRESQEPLLLRHLPLLSQTLLFNRSLCRHLAQPQFRQSLLQMTPWVVLRHQCRPFQATPTLSPLHLVIRAMTSPSLSQTPSLQVPPRMLRRLSHLLMELLERRSSTHLWIRLMRRRRAPRIQTLMLPSVQQSLFREIPPREPASSPMLEATLAPLAQKLMSLSFHLVELSQELFFHRPVFI